MTLFIFDYLVREKYPSESYWETAVIHAETEQRARELLDIMVKDRAIENIECTECSSEYSEIFW